AGRQVLHLAVDQGDDLGGGDVARDGGAEVDLDDANAEKGARLDVVEVVAARQGAFEDGGDGLLHVGGRHAAIGGEDDDDGHLEGGQHVGGVAAVTDDAKGQDEEHADPDEIGPAQGGVDQPHE